MNRVGNNSHNMRLTLWLNGRAFDSRSKGCGFESHRGHHEYLFGRLPHFFVAPEEFQGDTRENHLGDHDRELSPPGSQPGERDHDRGVTKGMFRDRDRKPVNCFMSLCCPQGKRGPHSCPVRLACNEVYGVIVSGLGGGPCGCSEGKSQGVTRRPV